MRGVRDLQFTIANLVDHVATASSWNERVEEIRRVPELFGLGQHHAAYAAIANALYRPHLSAQFAYVQWPPDYEVEPFRAAYELAVSRTDGFTKVDPDSLATTLVAAPRTLRVFRLIVGYTTNELAVAASQSRGREAAVEVRKAQLDAMEAGATPTAGLAKACAEAIHLLMTGELWEVAAGEFRSKLEKPDTANGWDSVRQFAVDGVPYYVLLHQRHYGGPFRTLLDATSSIRGDVLELPLQELLDSAKVPNIRTGAHNQAEIGERFGLTVRPTPDFVIFEPPRTLRAIIECKQANDGGTARDKAARFTTPRSEGTRLGGVPVFAVLDGLGWQRVPDALGPVVRDTDGRVFSLETLAALLEVQPLPSLVGVADVRLS